MKEGGEEVHGIRDSAARIELEGGKRVPQQVGDSVYQIIYGYGGTKHGGGELKYIDNGNTGGQMKVLGKNRKCFKRFDVGKEDRMSHKYCQGEPQLLKGWGSRPTRYKKRTMKI